MYPIVLITGSRGHRGSSTSSAFPAAVSPPRPAEAAEAPDTTNTSQVLEQVLLQSNATEARVGIVIMSLVSFPSPTTLVLLEP